MRIFYATDIHGSELCFRKFLRAATFYHADILLFGGDYSSKELVFIVGNAEGWRAQKSGQLIPLRTREDVRQFRSHCADRGIMTRVVTAEEFEELKNNDKLRLDAFENELRVTLNRWVELAAEALSPLGIRILTIPGNDDPQFAHNVLSRQPFSSVHAEHVRLDENFSLIGVGGSNPTPWNTYREYPEDKILELLERAWSRAVGANVILFVHVPPWNCGLDNAPKLTPGLAYDLMLGQAQLIPVGSRAVRNFIQDHQPLLGLFGHVHESAGHTRIGPTLCINPGSAYWQGVLRGCVVTLEAGRVKGFQLTEG